MFLPEAVFLFIYLMLAIHNIHLMNVGDFKAQLQNHQLESLRARKPAIGKQREL